MPFFSIDSYELSYLAIDDIHNKEPLIFLHGIMGNKKNLSTFVARLVKALPGYSAIIIDLPNHGQSSKHWHPLTVEGCAHAVAQLCQSFKPKIIAGHSFGGKVALLASARIPSIERLFLLDCPVGRVLEVRSLNRPESFTAFEVMDALERVPFPVSSRKEMVAKLTNQGVQSALALWMTTNLVEGADGLNLNFDPKDTRALLKDFVALDCWPMLARLLDRIFVYEVAAEHGQRVLSEEEHFKSVIDGRGGFEILSNSGHFVHADNPDGLIEIFKKIIL